MDTIPTRDHVRAMRWLMPFLSLPPLLASCGPADSPAVVNRIVFAGGAAPEMLKQCSRDAPALGEATWRPTAGDLDAMEALLPKALAGLPESRMVNFALEGWWRQDVGIVRGGRHFIYGNYSTIDPEDDGEWRKRPMWVCDGGPTAFGVEYDVAARQVTRIDFNGDAGSRYEGASYRNLRHRANVR